MNENYGLSLLCLSLESEKTPVKLRQGFFPSHAAGLDFQGCRIRSHGKMLTGARLAGSWVRDSPLTRRSI